MLGVQRLAASSSQSLQESAGSNWASRPRVTAPTRVALLLTPGPRNETYFEHAFLARYLGYHAGGRWQDLTVREQQASFSRP